MAYTKTTWVNDESPDIDADNLNKMEQGIYDAQYPDGGSEGQLLARTATGKAWVDAPNSAVWGLIQGTLSDQTDLAYALENTGKVDTVNGIEPDVSKNVQVDVELTRNEWELLPSSKYTDDINYYIKDGTNIPQASVISASGVQYDNTSSGLDATTVQGAIDENASEIADVKSGLTWKRILNVVTTANANYDQTQTVENIANYNEIMLTIQRSSNGRTFATSVCPVAQFQNAGLYAGGAYVLYAGLMNASQARWINAVAIWQSNTSVEIAVNANDEALTVRVWVR